ncbi:MAG: hypothetical protein NXY57DRAFT_1044989 [Lentinula lateritia]|nr:MAG: hypothetical protein NXY57DRAFT_1044989 [Lentinula lateritia]
MEIKLELPEKEIVREAKKQEGEQSTGRSMERNAKLMGTNRFKSVASRAFTTCRLKGRGQGVRNGERRRGKREHCEWKRKTFTYGKLQKMQDRKEEEEILEAIRSRKKLLSLELAMGIYSIYRISQDRTI